jgi:TP901 family phage tail tape measure protein
MSNSAVVGILRVLLSANSAELETAMKRASDSARTYTRELRTIGRQAESVGAALTKTLTVPLAAVGVAIAKVAIDFESSFAGVRKTVNATESELGAMARGFRELAKTIPVNVNELNAIGESAGQLGIQKDNIVAFTAVVAKLGVTTNLASTEAATSLARLANITGMPQAQFERLGSTIVALGNNFATTEREIVDMGLRLAGAGHQVGLTEPQILALAAALSSVGIEAEAGGTAMSRVMVDISKAVAEGGAQLERFASVAGLSAEAFADRFRTDAAGALVAFVEGLGKVQSAGGNTFQVLEELGQGNVRVRDALLRAAGAGDLMRNALELGSKAWAENTALTEEARKRFETTASQATVLWNRLRDVGITIGNALLPGLKALTHGLEAVIPLVDRAANLFAELPGAVQAAAFGVGALAAVTGPAIYALGQLAISASAITAAFTKKGVATRMVTSLLGGPFERTLRTAGTAVGSFGSSLAKVVPLMAGFEAALVGLGAGVAISLIVDEFQRTMHELEVRYDRTLARLRGGAAQREQQLADLVDQGKADIERQADAMKESEALFAKPLDGIEVRLKASSLALQSNGAISLDVAKMYERSGNTIAGALVTIGDHANQVTDPLAALREEAIALREKALVPLTAAQREVAIAFSQGGKSAAEIAAKLKVSEAAVESALDAHRRGTVAADKYAEALARVAQQLSGADAIERAKQYLEALRGVDLTKLTHDAQLEIASTMEAAIRVYRAAGQEIPAEMFRIGAAAAGLSGTMSEFTKALGQEPQLIGPKIATSLGVVAQSGIAQLIPPAVATNSTAIADAALAAYGPVRDLGKEIKTNLTDQVREIPDLLVRAFTGGGGVSGAIKALGTQIYSSIMAPLMAGLQKVKGGVTKATTVSVGAGLAGALGTAAGGGTIGTVAGLASSLTGAAAAAGTFGTAFTGATVASTVALGALTLGIGAAAIGAGLLIKHFTGTAGRTAVKKWVDENFGSFDALHQKLNDSREALQAAGYDSEQLWVALTQGVGRNDPKAAKKAIDDITKALEAADAKMQGFNATANGLLQQIAALGGTLPESLRGYLQTLADGKQLSAENVALLAQLTGEGTVNYQTLEDAVSRYGGKIEELGGTFQNARMHDQWQQVIDDMDLFERGGISAADALNLTKDKIVELVQQSIKFGTEIPENMRPWIQNLIDSHQLLDANGQEITDINKLTFGETLQTTLQQLTKALQDLVDTFRHDLPDAVSKVPKTVDIEFRGKRTGDWPDQGTGDGDVLRFARGGIVPPAYLATGSTLARVLAFRPRGTDTVPAMLTPGEAVLTRDQQRRLSEGIAMGMAALDRLDQAAQDRRADVDAMAQLVAATGTYGGGGGTAQFIADGRVLAEITVPHIPGVLKRARIGRG